MTPRSRPDAAPVAARLSRIAARVATTLQSLASWLPMAVALALSPGLFLWPALHRHLLGYVFDNQLAPSARTALLGAAVASLILVGTAYALRLERERNASRDATVASIGSRLNRTLFILLALPLLPALAAPDVESRAPLFALLVIAAIAAIVCAWVYWRAPAASTAPLARPRRLPALAITTLLAVAQGLLFARLAIGRHHAFETRLFDLGIYDNLLWNTSHGDLLRSTFVRSQSHVAAHVDPILILLAPLYRLLPRPETLLALQALWLASGAIPLHLLADKLLGNRAAALVVALAYLAHPALHGACLFDFHSITLSIPLTLWTLYAVEARGGRSCVIFFALLLSSREDAAFLAASIGLFVLLDGRRPTIGLLALVVSLAYLVVLKLVVMHHTSLLPSDTANSYGYESFYGDLVPSAGQGALGILWSLVTNPAFVLAHALSSAKQYFLLVLFVPILGLPAWARPGRVLLIYGLAFTLLSTRPPVHAIGFQYVAVILPFAMALVPYALASLRDRAPFGVDGARLFRGLVAGVAVASALTSWKFGAIVPNRAFRPGGIEMARDPSSASALAAALDRALALIPPAASLAVGDRLAPHASGRVAVERFSETSATDYVLVEPRLVEPTDVVHLAELRRSPRHRTLVDSAGLLLLGPASP